MWTLGGALYCEGNSDARFLAPLLLRLREDAAMQANAPVDVPETLVLDDAPEDRRLPRAERIARAALNAGDAWGVLFIHADADDREPGLAMRERVQPAMDLLAGSLGLRRQAVALIPVRETEAWLLVDPDALRAATGSALDDAALGLQHALRGGAERVRDPKALMNSVLEKAAPGSRPAQRAAYMARIGETASLDRLRRLAAFQRLETELHAAMRRMGMLP